MAGDLRRSRDRQQLGLGHAGGRAAAGRLLPPPQGRVQGLCGDGTRAGCDDRNSPARTLVGAQQEQWLYDGLQQSPARWQILAQQVFMAERDATAGEGESFSMDAWDGYKVSRDKLLDFIATRQIANPLVITGDVHQNWANDLLRDFSDENSQILGSEFVGTSISTTGDGGDGVNTGAMSENPWIRYNSQRRGVKRPGAPISTHRSFVVEAGDPA